MFGGLLVAAIAIASPFILKVLNRPPDLTPQECIRSIWEVNGVDVFTPRRQRILDRIAAMNCAELDAMMKEAARIVNANPQKPVTQVESANATTLDDAMKLRASIVGCQRTPDGGYVAPGVLK